MKLRTIIIILLFAISNTGQSQNLDDYFMVAAENNPGLQAKYKDFEAALEKIPQVSSLTDPSLSFGYFISPVETRVGPQRARFSLTQMFPWFGTLKAQGDAATLMAEAKYQTFIDTRNKLRYRVAGAYYALYELEKLKQIEGENIEILQSYMAIANRKFKNGIGSMTDLLRVEMMLNDAKTNLSILKEREKPLSVTFNKLLNREIGEEIIITDSLTADLPESFQKETVFNNNPILKELDLMVEASKVSENAAKKQGLPKIGVGLDYVIVGERTDMSLTDNGKDVIMPMVTVSIPIFRGKYKSNVKEAQIQQESYSLKRQDVANTLEADYEMATFEVKQQLEFLSLYEQQVQASEKSLTLQFTAYGNSGKDFEELLRMQQQLLKYRKLKATALKKYHVSLAKIDYITAKNHYDESK
ncbi:MAG: TolC family protein [Perlabentimonas sp.]